MITTMEMYWLVTLDSIVHVSLVFVIVSALATCATLGFVADVKRCFWLPVIPIGMFFLSIIALTFVPTTKQAAAIIIVPKLANSEKVQTVGNHLYELAVEWMEELRPENRHTKTKKGAEK